MAYTNAQFVRMLTGDSGLSARDVTSGDAVSREFYLSTIPVLGTSAAVYVGGTLKTEGGAADYTLDDRTGRLYFAVAPAAVTGNVVVTYLAVQCVDEDVAEACRQEGLDSTLTASAGEPAACLRAAVLLCLSKAAELATTNASESAAWAARADALRLRASTLASLTAGAVKREDGYSQDIKATDVAATGTNPRRRFYGQEDELP
jgi:hypothetical protein